MRTPAPHAPGWYPDQDDTSLVRYWDGQVWTGRLRPRPMWAPLETELIRLLPAPPPRRRLRDRVGALVVLVVVVSLVLGAVVVSRGRSVLPGRSRVTPMLTSARYVRASDAACAAVLRPAPARGSSPAPARGGSSVPAGGGSAPARGGSASAVTPAITRASAPAAAPALPPADVTRLARDAERIDARLQALPSGGADSGAVTTWLRQWDILAAVGASYMDALAHGTPITRAELAADFARARSRVDSSAAANGADHCRL